MRIKRASLTAAVNVLSFVLLLIPTFLVRRLFLDSLGEDLLGLTSLLQNVVGFLSLAELGFPIAVQFALYAPIARRDHGLIRAYLRYYARMYRLLGVVIMVCAVVIVPMLVHFTKGQVPLAQAAAAFALILLASLLSYFFSAKLILLTAAQEGYLVTLGFFAARVVIYALQVALLRTHPHYLRFLAIPVLVDLVHLYAMNFLIDRRYPWLRAQPEALPGDLRQALAANVRAVFPHKIGGFVINGTDNIVISLFLSLSAVARANNYVMVISTVSVILQRAFEGITAGLGNLLVAEGTRRAYEVHRNLFFLSFWTASLAAILLFNTLDRFIALWLGAQFQLDRATLALLLVNFYFLCMRIAVLKFIEAAGLYRQGRYAPFLESLVNLVSSVVLVQRIGLAGVFLGTLISNLTVVFWVGPLIVYRFVLGVPLRAYFLRYARYTAIACVPLLLSTWITANLGMGDTWPALLLCLATTFVVVNVCYLVVFHRTAEFSYFSTLLRALLRQARSRVDRGSTRAPACP